jgi:hypothetical protein
MKAYTKSSTQRDEILRLAIVLLFLMLAYAMTAFSGRGDDKPGISDKGLQTVWQKHAASR